MVLQKVIEGFSIWRVRQALANENSVYMRTVYMNIYYVIYPLSSMNAEDWSGVVLV